MKNTSCLRYLLGASFALYAAPLDAAIASSAEYLDPIVSKMAEFTAGDRSLHIVFHGHSVPTGYYTGGRVQPFQAYPYLLWETLNKRYEDGSIQIITTSIGGENAERGATRFSNDVLRKRPDVIFIDYALNDRAIGLERAETGWRSMIEAALAAEVKLILLTPTPDTREALTDPTTPLGQHAEQVRELAREYNLGLVDSYAAFAEYLASNPGVELNDLMAQGNHPNEPGHHIVADLLQQWFQQPQP